MSSHRRPSVLQRWGLVSSKRTESLPPQPGIEMVDARTRLTHRVSHEAMLASRLRGACRALCGA